METFNYLRIILMIALIMEFFVLIFVFNVEQRAVAHLTLKKNLVK